MKPIRLLPIVFTLLVGCGGDNVVRVPGQTAGSQPILNSQPPTLTNGWTASWLDLGDIANVQRTAIIIDATSSAPATPTVTTYAEPTVLNVEHATEFSFTLKSVALGKRLKIVIYGQTSGSTTYTILASSSPSPAVGP